MSKKGKYNHRGELIPEDTAGGKQDNVLSIKKTEIGGKMFYLVGNILDAADLEIKIPLDATFSKIHLPLLKNGNKGNSFSIKPRAGVICIYHPYEEGAERAPSILNEMLNFISPLDYEFYVIEDPICSETAVRKAGRFFKVIDCDVILLILATWSSDTLLLDLYNRSGIPLIIWGYNDVNSGSMCGTQQFCSVLKNVNGVCYFTFDYGGETLQRIKRFCRVESILRRLRDLRITMLGSPTPGMAEVYYDAFSIYQTFGIRIIVIGLEVFDEYVKKIDDSDIEEDLKEVKHLFKMDNVKLGDLKESVKIMYALVDVSEKNQSMAFAVGCYPHYMGKVCLGYALLSDFGLIGACEADVHSAILMFIMSRLSGMSTHHIDPLYLYKEENAMVGSHCGSSSPSLANDPARIKIAPVRLAGNGVCMMYTSRPGKVTLAHLMGGKSGYVMGIISAEAVETDLVFPGAPVKIKFPFSIDNFLKITEEYGLGHHWVVGYGDMAEELVLLCKRLKIKSIYFNELADG